MPMATLFLFFALAHPLLAAAPATQPTKPLNVIIIGADTLRADHLDLYGYKHPTSPNLDRLAARGVVFDRVFSQGSYTLSSFASLFTSRYAEQHHAVSKFTAISDTLVSNGQTARCAPITFPKQYRSGRTPNRPAAPSRPTRKPVITSSKMRSAPTASQARRSPARNPGAGGTSPMFAAIGSTMTQATCSSSPGTSL